MSTATRVLEAAHGLAGMVAAFSTVASDLEDRAAQGQLERAQSLVARLEAMTEELMRLVGGLSLDVLWRKASGVADLGRSAGG